MLADGTAIKCLTGVDDHSRFCVSARLMVKERTQAVCDALEAALATHGVPEQILTDNGKVFTGRYNQPPTEVLFDRICRVNGIEHLLTKPRSPTTTGKIERFHRSLRTEFLTDTTFASLAVAQERLDAWVATYNTDRPHQSLDMHTPAERYGTGPRRPVATTRSHRTRLGRPQGLHRRGRVRVLATGLRRAPPRRRTLRRPGRPDILQFWIGNELLRTVQRLSSGPVRNKRPLGGALTKTPEPDTLNARSVKDQPTHNRQQSPEVLQPHHVSAGTPATVATCHRPSPRLLSFWQHSSRTLIAPLVPHEP